MYAGVPAIAPSAPLSESSRARRAVRAAQQLDGHLAVELRIVRRVDEAHASRAQRLHHDVAADQRPARQLAGQLAEALLERRALALVEAAGGDRRLSARAA